MLLPWPAGFVQDLVRFMRGKPLIPQVNGQAGQLAQLGRKGLRLLGLRAQLGAELLQQRLDDAVGWDVKVGPDPADGCRDGVRAATGAATTPPA